MIQREPHCNATLSPARPGSFAHSLTLNDAGVAAVAAAEAVAEAAASVAEVIAEVTVSDIQAVVESGELVGARTRVR